MAPPTAMPEFPQVPILPEFTFDVSSNPAVV